jgi:hypothetical protein
MDLGHIFGAPRRAWGKQTPYGTMFFAEKNLAQFLLDISAR